jgi:hypothetical protein
MRLGWTPTAALVALLLPAACGSTGQPPATTPPLPAALVAQARPIGRGVRFQPPAGGPVVGRCDRGLGAREGVHVEVFAANRVLLVPAGIGTRPPRRFSAGRISSARCYGELVTLDPTGLVLVRAGSRPALADLFRAWGEPLSTRRLASFAAVTGTGVAVFVDGRRWRGSPGGVPLALHSEIVLEIGPYVPPHRSYTFPPGT